ncbi:hypothetical protein BD770DRAFT_377562 [Pilaira anomala]|nr:hypothetical protein BD770DRAFT_377562 [Pilaira anomala]
MNLGESSRVQQSPIQSEETLLGSQHQDDRSGLIFQKRFKATHHTEVSAIREVQRNNDIYDLNIPKQLNTPSPEKEDTASIVTAATMSSQATQGFDRPLPSNHIPTTEYSQHIPKELDPNSRLRQLLIWFINIVERESSSHRQKNPITERVKRAIVQQLHTSRRLVSQNRQTHVSAIHIKPNPENEENRRLCALYEKEIKILEAETEEWKRDVDQIYERHALAVDKVASLEASGFKVEESMDFLSDVKPDQQEFIKQLLDTKAEDKLNDFISTMDAEMTQFRSTLGITNEFYLKSSRLANQQIPRLARLLHESTRLIPIDADENELGLFENTEERRKEDEIRSIECVFKLLQSTGKK